MMTHPAPHEPPAPRERPPPCATSESSATPSHGTPQESAPVADERPLCPKNKNITMNSNEQA
jgi:hypothetical protein